MFVHKLKSRQALQTLLSSFISIETMKTPNPNFLKFFPIGHHVLGQQGTLDISSREYSDVSPLAIELFKLPGVTRIFYGPDYLSIAKKEELDWDALKPDIFRIVSHHFQNKIPLLTEAASLCNLQITPESDEIDPNDPEVVQFIKQIIASRVRPNVQQDGGDVRFVSFDESSGVLRIKMVGACAGCPSSAATLKGGIEKMLTYYVKEIKEVISQQDCAK